MFYFDLNFKLIDCMPMLQIQAKAKADEAKRQVWQRIQQRLTGVSGAI